MSESLSRQRDNTLLLSFSNFWGKYLRKFWLHAPKPVAQDLHHLFPVYFGHKRRKNAREMDMRCSGKASIKEEMRHFPAHKQVHDGGNRQEGTERYGIFHVLPLDQDQRDADYRAED
jgi:hypothetical protein